jgi:hypothetical protein
LLQFFVGSGSPQCICIHRPVMELDFGVDWLDSWVCVQHGLWLTNSVQQKTKSVQMLSVSGRAGAVATFHATDFHCGPKTMFNCCPTAHRVQYPSL